MKSYRRAAGETTEWEDVQRRFGNKLSTFDEIEAAEKEAAKDDVEWVPATEETTKEKLEEAESEAVLEEMEDDGDVDDDRFLESLRKKRLAELRARAERNRFGSVVRLSSRSEWVSEVTEASKGKEGVTVIVHLADEREAGSVAMEPHFAVLATRHPETKFVQIRAEEAIPGYPSKNVPTILVYKDGEVAQNLVGLSHFGGKRRLGPEVLEWVLASTGAIKTELTSDPLEDDDEDLGPGMSRGGFVARVRGAGGRGD